MSSEQIPPQAANNATGQQLQAAPPTIVAPASSSASIDSLQCQWAGCSDRAATAELLYEHVCERHVGRKSTNNLNLTCQWGNCRTSTVKRDHITSHIRVHVPLKPHKCDFCGKSFKRPQDLKKHVKTHADESVLMRSPEPASGSRHHPNGGYGNMNNQPRPQGGYYPEAQMQQNMPMNYGAYQGHNPNGGTHTGYYAPTAQSTSHSYGPVYYNVTNGNETGNQAAYNDRKRGTELVDNLFGSIKRHEFDPHSYSDISSRLVPFHNVQLPLLSGGGGMSEYQPSPALMSSHGGPTTLFAPTAPHGYSLPIPNLRTKQDMVDAENYLQNMVQTAYESSTSVAVAGVAQPGAHDVSTGLTRRTSTSPPSISMGRAHIRDPQASHASTPQLTPGSSHGSSHGSHYSEHSPTSGVSPTEQHHTMSHSSGYPTLPNAASMAGQLPSSTLGNQYDHDIRRRYSGGRLQKAAPGAIMKRDHEMNIVDRHSATPHPEVRSRSVAPHMIDPALSGYTHSQSSSPTSTASPTGGAVDETWVYNVRLLEDLKEYVSARLERGEYEEDDLVMEEEPSLYPVLK